MRDREARWTPNPVAEREMDAARRGRLARRRVGWALAASSLTCPVYGFGLLIWMLGGPPLSLWIVVPIVLAPLGLLAAWASSRARDLKTRRVRLRDLRHEFGQARGALAEVTIYQGSAPTGRDQGVVWSEDDRLYFAGRRTSFALLAGDASGPIRMAVTVPGVRSSLTLPLTDGVSLGFDPLSADADPALIHQGLVWEVQRWSHRWGPGGGQGPPLASGPDAPTSHRLLARALGASVCWVLGSGGALWTLCHSLNAGLILVAALAVLGSFTAEVWAPALRWRAWRDRRRLERRNAR